MPESGHYLKADSSAKLSSKREKMCWGNVSITTIRRVEVDGFFLDTSSRTATRRLGEIWIPITYKECNWL